MKTTHESSSHPRLDVASLALMAIGVASGIFSYYLVVDRDLSPLVALPSVVAIVLGAMNLVKKEAPRETRSHN